MASCPTCFKNFESDAAMKAHHYHIHNESIADGSSEQITCSYCGEKTTVQTAPGKDLNHRFCDRNCYSSWMEDRPSKAQYGKDRGYWWRNLREKVLERDGQTCRYCGIKRQKHLELHNQDLHVHHLGDEKDHRLENLITLCKGCHQQEHYSV